MDASVLFTYYCWNSRRPEFNSSVSWGSLFMEGNENGLMAWKQILGIERKKDALAVEDKNCYLFDTVYQKGIS